MFRTFDETLSESLTEAIEKSKIDLQKNTNVSTFVYSLHSDAKINSWHSGPGVAALSGDEFGLTLTQSNALRYKFTIDNYLIL